MATVDAFNYTHEGALTAARPQRPALPATASSTRTYCYRTAAGARGTTTDPDAIPAGAEVERTVTA